MYYRSWNNKRVVKSWEFNGASLDQGLTTHYFLLHHQQLANSNTILPVDHNPTTKSKPKPNTNISYISYISYEFVLIDTNSIELTSVTLHNNMVQLQKKLMKPSSYFKTCNINLKSPQSLFIHFTGKKKPWIQLQLLYKKYLNTISIITINNPSNGNSNNTNLDVNFDDMRRSLSNTRGVSKQELNMLYTWLLVLTDINQYAKEHSGKVLSINSNSMVSFQKIVSPLGYFAANI